MDPERPPKPLYSTRAEEPEAEERIDAFVVGLGETVDSLQDAEATRDFRLLRERAARLAAEALARGYAPMAAAAERVAEGCEAQEPELAHKAVADVTELAQRIRRGHRSAA
jgi:hypothetical protein